jgi:hypothetical protein
MVCNILSGEFLISVGLIFIVIRRHVDNWYLIEDMPVDKIEVEAEMLLELQ